MQVLHKQVIHMQVIDTVKCSSVFTALLHLFFELFDKFNLLLLYFKFTS